jgi:hypothetical protein
MEKLPDPTWSDGASLTKFIKQTALGFKDPWLPLLKKGVTGVASAYYPEDETDHLKADDDVWAYDDKPESGDVYPLNQAMDAGMKYMTVEQAERLGHKEEQHY